MKQLLLTLSATVLGTALISFGQTAEEKAKATGKSDATAQTQGLGRGGAPLAWCDKNKDGICDITGKPVGQGRAQGARAARGGSQGRGCGRAAGAPRGGRNMRGGCGCGGGADTAAPPK